MDCALFYQVNGVDGGHGLKRPWSQTEREGPEVLFNNAGITSEL